MEKLETVVWGVIGAGDVCERKSVPALYTVAHSEVKTVMRRNAAKAEDFARRHAISNWTTDVDALLADADINAIYIATPPNVHAELTLKAAKAGKAVYVEKPMANSTAECEAMVKACSEANVPLFVAYYRRTLPGFLKVKELINNAWLGEIRAVNIEMYKALTPSDINNVESNWRVDPDIAGGGYFHDLASHALDYLDFLFGEITNVHGFSSNQAKAYRSDDIVTANFTFENAVLGTGLWCFASSKCAEKDSVRIIGSKGELSFNCFGDPMTIDIVSEEHGHQTMQFLHQQPVQQPLVQLIVDELRGVGTCASKGDNGTRATAVMEAITKREK